MEKLILGLNKLSIVVNNNKNIISKQLDKYVKFLPEYNNNKSNIVEQTYKKVFTDWIKNNSHHTFPKRKRKWINLIKGHLKLYRPVRFYRPYVTLRKIFLSKNKLTPLLETFKYRLFNYLKYKKIELTKENFNNFLEDIKYCFSVIYEKNPEEIFDILLKNNIIVLSPYKKPKVNKNLFIFEREIIVFSNSKRKNNLVSQDCDKIIETINKRTKSSF